MVVKISHFKRHFSPPRHTESNKDIAVRSSRSLICSSGRWVEMCVCVSEPTRYMQREWVGYVLANPTLTSATYLPFMKHDSRLLILSHFPLVHFDARVLNCNPEIYYLLFQKKDKEFLCINTVQLPFCPHTEKGIIIFKKLPNSKVFFVMFPWIIGPTVPPPAPSKYPTCTAKKM